MINNIILYNIYQNLSKNYREIKRETFLIRYLKENIFNKIKES